jgi:hypothetical protein
MDVNTFFEEIEDLSPKRQLEGYRALCAAMEKFFGEEKSREIDEDAVLELMTPKLCSLVDELNGWDAFGTEGLDV